MKDGDNLSLMFWIQVFRLDGNSRRSFWEGKRNNSKKGSTTSTAKNNNTVIEEDNDSICQKDVEPDFQRYFST